MWEILDSDLVKNNVQEVALGIHKKRETRYGYYGKF